MEPAVWGLIGTIVGAISSLLATYLTNVHSRRLSADLRAQERLDKFQEFQRETLLELQGAIHEVARTTFLLHLEDSKSLISGVSWGAAVMPDKLADEDRVARGRVALYVERVADDQVRGMVKQLMMETHAAFLATSKAEADRLQEKISLTRKKVMEAIGEVLRATY